jgi:riboflavin transporter FmnP
MNKGKKLNYLIKSAMLAGLAFLLSKFEFPILPMAPFLKYDISNLPILLGSFILGPAYGMLILFIKSVIQSIQTNPFGVVMGFIASFMFIFPSSLYYKKNRSFKGGIISLIIGSAVVITGMIPVNYYGIILYSKITSDQLIPASQLVNYSLFIVPTFNVIKCTLDSILLMLIYKRAGFLLK